MRIGIMGRGRIGAFPAENSATGREGVEVSATGGNRGAEYIRAGTRTSLCTVADAIEASLIAEACTLALREHRPVRLDEVRK